MLSSPFHSHSPYNQHWFRPSSTAWRSPFPSPKWKIACTHSLILTIYFKSEALTLRMSITDWFLYYRSLFADPRENRTQVIPSLPNNYYAEKFLCQYILAFTEFPTAFGLLESVFRAIVNRSRACPPLFLPAVFVADWRAGLLTISWPHHSHKWKFKV